MSYIYLLLVLLYPLRIINFDLSTWTNTDLLGTELVKKLLSSTCVLLSSKSREVVRATLEFIKVTIGVLPASELVPHVEDLVR